MAKTLTTPISIVNAITSIAKWEVFGYQDNDALASPTVNVIVRVWKLNTTYGLYSLVASDVQNSLCLMVNLSPASLTDQLITGYQDLSANTPYTAITNAHDAAVGNQKAKKVAVEAVLVARGLLSAAFAGS